jgi:hypothetical protein
VVGMAKAVEAADEAVSGGSGGVERCTSPGINAIR